MKPTHIAMALVGLVATPAFAAPQWVEDACWMSRLMSAFGGRADMPMQGRHVGF